MQFTYADWCSQHIALPPQQFLQSFERSCLVSPAVMTDLAAWLFCNYPANLALQDLVWQRAEAVPLELRTKVQDIAYRAYLSRQVRELSAPPDVKKLWSGCMGKAGFVEVFQTVFGCVPDAGLTVEGALELLVNLAVFKLVLYDRRNLDPETGKHLGASVIAGLQLSTLSVPDTSTSLDPRPVGVDATATGRRIVSRRVEDLRSAFSRTNFKNKELAIMRRHLLGLCGFIEATFAGDNYRSCMEEKISVLLPAQMPAPSFGLLTGKYVQAELNLLRFFQARLANHALTKTLAGTEMELERFLKEVNQFREQPLAPKKLCEWHAHIGSLNRNLVHALDTIFSPDNEKLKTSWIFPLSPRMDGAALITCLSQPLYVLEDVFTDWLSKDHILSLDDKLRVLPKSGQLLACMKCLYGTPREFAFLLQQMQLVFPEMLFHVSERNTTASKTHERNKAQNELCKLITRIKRTEDIERARSGDIMHVVNNLNLDLHYYLDELVAGAIEEAEEVLDIAATIMALLQSNSDNIEEVEVGVASAILFKFTQNTAEILEAFAWLQHYFAEQRGVWNEGIFPERSAQGDAGHVVVAPQRKKKSRKRSLAKIASVDDGSGKAAQPSPLVKQQLANGAQPEEPARSAVEVSGIIEEESEEESHQPSAAEIWKAKVESCRALKAEASHLRRIAIANRERSEAKEEDLMSVQRILKGSLRRKDPLALAALRKQKVAAISNEIRKEGWILDHVTGDHHIYKHPTLEGSVVLPFSSGADMLKKGTFNGVAKVAGWMD